MSRSLKKGPYIDYKLEKKIDLANTSNKKQVNLIKTCKFYYLGYNKII